MSDILASIRKIMAQEPASAPSPGPTRATLNGVSGTALDLSREPELKLPPRKSEAEDAAKPAAQAGEPVSLDELLAETSRVTTPSGPATKPPVPVKSEPPEAGQSASAPEWLFPRPSPLETANDTSAKSPVQIPPPAKDANASPVAKVTTESAPSGPAISSASSEQPNAAKEPPSPALTIGPPVPKLGDLGSVVPARFDGTGSAPSLETGPARSEIGDRPVLGPPLAGPLLGEPARTPAAADPIPDVPGADALRRLIAGVIPPSAHPSVAPSAKAPEAGPAPATARSGDAPKEAPKADAGLKPASETKAETLATPALQPSITKKIDAPAPTRVPEPKPAAAAAPVITPAPPPKPATSAIGAKIEPAKPTASPTTAAAPSPQPPTKPAPAGKSMDETVVELLRPLLKDWLDTNMPRLIEPALKAELEALRNVAAKDRKD